MFSSNWDEPDQFITQSGSWVQLPPTETRSTFISLMDASVSTENDVSQLPLREEAPPSEASVAADRVDAVLEPLAEETTSN